MFDYKTQYTRYLNIFNEYLEEVFSALDKKAPKTITSAMEYAVKNGGKRVRPVLCLAAAELLKVPFDCVKNICVALECIHSYSLVHDDLPAMDNDDFRRGKPSTHKKFGEANGVLAGDALLNFAVEICLDKKSFNFLDAKAMKVLFDYSGYRGMIAGQVLDLEKEKTTLASEKDLYAIYENKTAKLLTAPLLIASIYADNKYYEQLLQYGYHLGITFQIIDDIMDVEGSVDTIGKTPNKDAFADKFTSIKLYGLDGAKLKAEYHYKKCKDAISNIENNEFLSALADAMFIRRK